MQRSRARWIKAADGCLQSERTRDVQPSERTGHSQRPNTGEVALLPSLPKSAATATSRIRVLKSNPRASAIADGDLHSGSHSGPELLHHRPHRSPLVLWHLLSLDAPTVAATWTIFIAHCAGIALPWTAPAAMFVAVWMLYAADRLLDARPLPDGSAPPELEERHRFHQRHRHAFLCAIVAAAGILAELLRSIDARSLELYALLATMLAAWLLLIHARPLPTASARRLPKELAVGIFFPAAIFIPTIARAPQLQPALIAPALLLAAVCTLNCLFLYAWEHPESHPAAHWTTRWASSHVRLLAPVAIAVSLLILLLSATSVLPRIDIGPAVACALSASLLFVLSLTRRFFSTLVLRAAADLVLLTPLLLLAK